MEKSLLNEPSAMNDDLSGQIDSDVTERVQCSSPERHLPETNNSSPTLNETPIDGKKHAEKVNIDSNEGQVVREIVVDVQESVGLVHHTQVNGPVILENSESAFVCKYPGCNFTTIDAELYLKHEDSHVDIGAVSCDACGMTFRTYASMRRHHLYVHQGIRTFECQYCSKRFLRKEQFVEHLAKHTKPRPFNCSFCGETFNFRSHLKTHLSLQHLATYVDGKTCHLCNFKASSPNAIKVHYATFHLKNNMDGTGIDIDRARDLCGNSHILDNQHENGAIDLAAVSQNFSFMTSHYPSYSHPGNENNISMPGPSDLSCRTKVIRRATSPIPNIQNLTSTASEQNAMQAKDDNRHTCVTSLAGSTVVSPPTCQDSVCQRLELRARQRMCIKPEPPELTVDDSQNSNVQPTSTMDLSTNEVETTQSDNLCRRKVHKHSSSDDTCSESHNSPSNRLCGEAQPVVRTPHTCFRFRPYDEGSSQRCREYAKHTCLSHGHPERGARFSESDIAQNEQSDGEERKIFYSRATSTNNSIVPGDVSRGNLVTTFNAERPTMPAPPHGVTNYFGRKNIIIRDIESCTLTCTFCGIIFPDQTLYLLHRSLHSDNSPWKCNLCGKICSDKYDFNSHIISKGHY